MANLQRDLARLEEVLHAESKQLQGPGSSPARRERPLLRSGVRRFVTRRGRAQADSVQRHCGSRWRLGDDAGEEFASRLCEFRSGG